MNTHELDQENRQTSSLKSLPTGNLLGTVRISKVNTLQWTFCVISAAATAEIAQLSHMCPSKE